MGRVVSYSMFEEVEQVPGVWGVLPYLQKNAFRCKLILFSIPSYLSKSTLNDTEDTLMNY